MNTRLSWRNQDRLWKALGEPTKKPVPAPPRTREEIEAMWWLSKTSRNLLLRDLEKKP
jgi:hypothetical protein